MGFCGVLLCCLGGVESRFDIFRIARRDGVAAVEPAAQINVGAAAGAEGTVRFCGLGFADWTGHWPAPFSTSASTGRARLR